MNRQIEMDKFIKYIALVSEENQDIKFDEKIIYSEMINFLVPKEYKEISIFQLFVKWINHFKTYQKIDAFIDPNWNKYIQFYRNAYALNSYCYKLSLSLNDIGFKSSAIIMLLDFLDQQEINFMVKIFYKIKSDSITIRVNSSDEVTKIIDYIKNNQLFHDNMLKNNPFIICQDNIGICYDQRLSYNFEVAVLINNYIRHLSKTLDYGNASYNGFCFFVNEIKKAMINDSDYINEYKSNRIPLNGLIADNYEFIKEIDLIQKAILNKVLFEDIRKTNINDNELDIPKITYLEKATYDTYNTLGLNQTKLAVYEYVKNNNFMGFTRENRCRYNLTTNTNRYLIKQEIMSVSDDLKIKGTIELYVEITLQKIRDIQEEVLKKLIQLIVIKYKDEWSLSSSLESIKSHDYSVFTRDYNIRSTIKYLFIPKDILLTMRRTMQKENPKYKYLNDEMIVKKYESFIIDSIK